MNLEINIFYSMRALNRLLALMVSIVASLGMFAGQINEVDALEKAKQFMPGKNFIVKRYSSSSGAETKNPFYIFNAVNNDGYVLVSGDDRTAPILGYSTSGNLDLSKIPDNFRYWLDSYAQQIESLDKGATPAKTRITRAEKVAINPLIQTKWDQGSPYNLQCPKDPKDPDATCLTGCVATAMAQVMYYHKWPENCPDIPAYTPSGWSNPLPALPAVSFKWDKMMLTYDYGVTGEAADAVAELMRYCGQSMQMGYSSSGSGACIDTDVLKNIFDYSDDLKVIYRDQTATDTWDNLIYQELAEGRPVLYSGQSKSGGHQFICDGYDGNGLYHINWGWGGYCDDYFLLSVVNPFEGEGEGYQSYQDAVIGVKPKTAPSDYSVVKLTFPADILINQQTTFTVTLTNTGTTSRQTVYFWIKQDGSWVRTASANGIVGQGQTGDVELVFTPISLGTFDVKVTSDYEGEVIKSSSSILVSEPQEFTVNGLKYLCSPGSKTAVVMQDESYTSLSSVTIPASITAGGTTYAVTAIGNNAFQNCYDLSTLTLSEGLISIGDNAFESCFSLSSLALPSTLRSIGSFAFIWCNGILELVIPEGCVSIGEQAFFNLYSLQKVELPSTLTSIAGGAFAVNPLLVSVISRINDPFVIADNTFASDIQWNNNVEQVTPPSAVLYVPVGTKGKYESVSGWSMFSKIEEGEPREVTVKDLKYMCSPGSKTATVINGEQYQELTAADIPATITADGVEYSVTAIGNGAFSQCYQLLKSVAIPNTVTSIGERAFWNCGNLKSLIIPEGVTSIGRSAFGACFNLTKLILPSTLTSIGSRVINYCSALESVVSYVSEPFSIDEYTFMNSMWDNSAQKEIYSPSSATLYVPIGTKSKYEAISGWTKFAQIVEGELNEAYVGDLKYVYFADSKTATVVRDVNYENLRSVEIPASITVNGVDYSVTAIEDNAFKDCYNLRYVDILGDATTIGSEAFSGCYLTYVKSHSTNPCTITKDVFCLPNNSNPYDLSAILYVPKGTKTKYTEAGWTNFSSIVERDLTDPQLVYQYDDNTKTAKVIAGDYELFTEIEIPKKVSYNSVEYTVTGIGQGAFAESRNVERISIPASVTKIEERAFVSCPLLSTYIVDKENEIYKSSYSAIIETASQTLIAACNGTTIPKGVKSIGDYAFWGYVGYSLTIPGSVTSLGSNVFDSQLSRVICFAKTPPAVKENTFAGGVGETELKVYSSVADQYKAASIWKDFGSLVIIPEKEEIVKMLSGTKSGKSWTWNSDTSTGYVWGNMGYCGGDGNEVPNGAGVWWGVSTAEELKDYLQFTPDGQAHGDESMNAYMTLTPDGTIVRYAGDGSVINSGTYSIEVVEDNDWKIANLHTTAGTILFPYEINSNGNMPTVFEVVSLSDDQLTLVYPDGGRFSELGSWDEATFWNFKSKTESVTISSSGKRMFVSDTDLDFSDDAVKAYIVSGCEGNTIWLTRVKDVPAGTPVMLKGEPDDYQIPITTSFTHYPENLLRGSATATSHVVPEEGGYVNMFLSKTDGAFYKFGSEVDFPAGMSYLHMPVTSFADPIAGDAQTITIPSSGKYTYCPPVDLDFTGVDGLTAYIGTGFEKSGKLWLSKVNKVQAGTPLLLKGNAGSRPVVPSVGTQTEFANLFKGSATQSTSLSTTTGGYTNYFVDKSGAFVLFGEDPVDYPAGRSYLQIPTAFLAGEASAQTRSAGSAVIESEEAEVISMEIILGEGLGGDGTTGIDVQQSDGVEDVYFNLQGQRVDNPGKGIYIKNGKVVVISSTTK